MAGIKVSVVQKVSPSRTDALQGQGSNKTSLGCGRAAGLSWRGSGAVITELCAHLYTLCGDLT